MYTTKAAFNFDYFYLTFSYETSHTEKKSRENMNAFNPINQIQPLATSDQVCSISMPVCFVSS